MNTSDSEIRYPVGIQSFPEIISGGYVYVDKTAFIHMLVREGKYYFLARPRRFGKSLLLSTIEAYFQGRRELFKGLALDSLTDDWDAHPVLHLDLNTADYTDPDSLNRVLNSFLDRWENLYGPTNHDTQPSLRFGEVIRNAFAKTGKQVVILIDEYDKPLLNCVDNEPLADRFRNMLKAFYGNLKSMDDYIKIGIMTGVARFSKVSIFSDVNNLRDISFQDEYSAICGISQREVDTYFDYGIRAIADKTGKSVEETRMDLRKIYDGYHFSRESEDIYNPYSLMYAFANKTIGDFWFESGTPSFLAKRVRNGHYRLKDLDSYYIDASALATAGIMSKNPIPVLFQSGYLTIKGYDEEFNQYILGYPNAEVKNSFLKALMPLYVEGEGIDTNFDIRRFVHDVRNGECEEFMNRLDAMVAAVPYSEKGSAPEAHFQNVIYLIFTLMGYYTQMEQRISNGRIDVTVETSDYVYIFEFKINASAEAAMAQIHEKEYWRPYKSRDKQIIMIGASFNSSERRLDSYLIERL